MSSVVFGRAHVSEELECGFIPSNIIDELQSNDSSQHIEAAQNLLSLSEKSPIESIDFKSFLIFSAQFFLDDNFSVINCFNEIVEGFLPQVGQSAIDVLEEFLTMIITPLSDDRRAVRILVVNLMLLYIDTTRSLDLLRALLPLFPDQPVLAKTEMLDFATQSIQRLRPTNALYPVMAEAITEALKLTDISIQNAAARLLNQICSINPEFIKMLPQSATSFLSDEDQRKLQKAAAVRRPAPPSLPLLVKTPIIPKPQLNPRGRNLILRPNVNKNNKVHVTSHSGPQAPSGRAGPLPPMQPEISEDPLNELRDRYQCQSQPGIHPPAEPRPPEHAGRSSQAPRAPRLRISQDKFKISPPGSNHSQSPNSEPLSEIDEILNNLQNNDWEIQNDTIISLIEMVQTKPKFVSSNLRAIVFALMTSVSSLRSALAETALTCLRDISSEFGEDMTPFFESILNHLLTVLMSNRPAIARLAADCISAILVNIDRDAALKFLGKDHSEKSSLIKEHLSLCIDALCGDCTDPSELLDTIGMLLLDESDNTKEHATASLLQLNQNFENLKDLDVIKNMDTERREAIMNILKDCRPLPEPVL
ncbi:hypothetical protein TRFO_05637 [Tritrichomonas foetus]|uniref:TOG domain-containing protein n=1 Tax=Tritrichomonas foetus TaxID=1144522 RepID=A0A1J4K6B9_9EUKA|nr:hypothetical protein TRFO_05637 [Tritrichomonas foetus]|eukprot:OHT06424.1 hypothetical protein TRFO_05637 [Tritrichomonas foetus]